MQSKKSVFIGILLAWVFLISWAIYKEFDGETITVFIALAVLSLTSSGFLLNTKKKTTCICKKTNLYPVNSSDN